MQFNSLEFVFFFIAVIAVYFALPRRSRWVLLLAASYYFYMCWKMEYIFLIVVSTLIDYLSGLMMGRFTQRSVRSLFLSLSIVANLGVLFFFKYWDFFNDNVRELFNQFNIFYDAPVFDFLLPVGISFYTFQSMSYTIDVFRGVKEPEKHLGIFALYIAFFPQLVAGPIERSTHLFPQLKDPKRFSYDRASEGLRLILWGLFKKIVIADRLAMFVDMAFNNVGMHSGITHIVATWFFCIQVYCDFSGYSDIAIGTAKIMGVDLMVNFNKIYWSKSVTEYWQRNHISLTTWFRDYLYFPLGGGRVPTWRKYLNVMIIFLVSGLWHGAAWTFVFWGALNGFYLVYEIATRSIRAKVDKALGFYKIPRIKGLVRILMTFNVIAFGLFFFRANSMQDASEMFSIIFSGDLGTLSYGSLSDFVYGIFGIFVLFAVEYIQRDKTLERGIGDLPLYGRWGLYVFLCMSILMIGVFDGGQFIYFQF